MSSATRSCVVTGASGAVGLAVATQLAAEGWRVVGVDVQDGSNDFPTVVGDVCDEDVLERAATIAEATAPLAGWVNNAAAFVRMTLDDLDLAEFRRAIDVNLIAAVVGSSIAVRRFLAAERGGSIVNVSSLQGHRAFRSWMPYGVSKAALEALTRATAVDYGDRGIRANAVAPGTLTTKNLLAWADADDVRRLSRSHPLNRLGEPAEVAALVAFLLGDGAAFITGASIPVDGGRSIFDTDEPQT